MTISQLIARLRELQIEAGSKDLQVFTAQLRYPVLEHAEPVDGVRPHANRQDAVVLW